MGYTSEDLLKVKTRKELVKLAQEKISTLKRL